MNEKSFNKWQKFHRLGKIKFILVMVLIFILVGNITLTISNEVLKIFNLYDINYIGHLAFSTGMMIVGIIYSLSAWTTNEIEYNKYLKKDC